MRAVFSQTPDRHREQPDHLMTTYEAWVRFSSIKFPQDSEQFEGYVIASCLVKEVVYGGAVKELQAGKSITIKGNVPSMHPAFMYLLRFKRGKKQDEFDILPQAGFKESKRLPWTMETLEWSMAMEMKWEREEKIEAARAELRREMLKSEKSIEGTMVVPEGLVRQLSFYDSLLAKSDYYRLTSICSIKRGWPGSLKKIRELPADLLERLIKHISSAPHELCFYSHSRIYGLGEMTYVHFKAVWEEAERSGAALTKQTLPVHRAAVALYSFIGEQRKRWGHTIFSKEAILWDFKSKYDHSGVGAVAEGALNWMIKEGHLVYLDENGVCISDRAMWYANPSPIKYIQTPRDDYLKESILGHIRRIYMNFLAAGGDYEYRDIADPVPAVPKGICNTKQKQAVRHVFNNPITIIQGGPGSGKTFVGVDHLACLFKNIGIETHVGRQAVSLCDRLGGHHEIARTIHSAHASHGNNLMRIFYDKRKKIAILDEVYNADDRTMEWALSLYPDATRLIMIGDPDQIRPIPDEAGAGTPALDIARAMPQHVIYLSENMRQRENAKAIHNVVLAVKEVRPRSIKWGVSMERDAAVMINLPPRGQPVDSLLHSVIDRLRKGTNGDENAWQLVTFYNGSEPEKQGLGASQLNVIVEDYLDKIGFFKQRHPTTKKLRVKIHVTERLVMYPGYKFMFSEKMVPHKSLMRGGKKKNKTKKTTSKKRATPLLRQSQIASSDDDEIRPIVVEEDSKGRLDMSVFFDEEGTEEESARPRFNETKNGQIEVVKEIKPVKMPGVRGTCYHVECEPKGKSVYGTRFLISRKLHVDPSKIHSAWAVSTNKSMGGENTNVGVYLPPELEKSFFDRSNLYVAVSRPTDFLVVLGSQQTFEYLTRKDPVNVRSGLFARLKTAPLVEEWQKEVFKDRVGPETFEAYKDLDMRIAHDHDKYGFVVGETIERFGGNEDFLYDQTWRTQSEFPITVCDQSFSEYAAETRKVALENPKDWAKHVKEMMEEIRKKLYHHVKDNTVLSSRVSIIPDIDKPPVIEAEDVAVVNDEGKRESPESQNDDPVTPPRVKKPKVVEEDGIDPIEEEELEMLEEMEIVEEEIEDDDDD